MSPGVYTLANQRLQKNLSRKSLRFLAAGRRWLIILVRFYRAREGGEHLVRPRASSKYLPPPYKLQHGFRGRLASPSLLFSAFLVDLTRL